MDVIQKRLLETKALLEKGWCQKTYFKIVANRPCYSLDGAIREVCADQFEESKIRNIVLSTIFWLEGEDSCIGIYDWNDNPLRTYNEVLNTIARAYHQYNISIALNK